ncbi:M23 family metallopeptidase [Paracoccus sanguinis]|uniref:M23 family metallopeptidase n=1 Tax=Paracoccus sanguinis TaxID=1545044 RepID=UPI000B1F61D1|nr:M23 family metallopeptidase [Paracoccus sanguinis]
MAGDVITPQSATVQVAEPLSGRLIPTARRGLALAAVLTLAACAQSGAQPGAQPGAVGAGPASSAAVPGVAMPQVAVPRVQMPTLRWPFGGAAGAAPGAAPAAAGTPQVRDPFAGQGVAQPGVPPAAGTRATAATSKPAASAPAATAPARTHTVVAGETGWSVARKYGISIQDLARANNLPETMSIRVGQRLAIPAGGTTVAAADATAPGVGSPTPLPPSAAKPLPAERTQPASTPAPRGDAPDLGKTRTGASGSGKFAMPVNGSIVRAYKKGSNEGIDISAPAGTPVKAAGGGTVAAITRDTDGVPIVVVRHDDGLMTVYAGLDKLSVAKGDPVKRGQSMGTARNSGVVHFEVRKGFDSVDPEGYL